MFKEMKKFLKYGTNTIITILLILGIAIILVALSRSHHKRYDMTEEKAFTLSEQTRKILKNLDKNVTVFIFYSKGSDFLEKAKTQLEQLTYYSRRLTVISKNTDRFPAEARKYNLTDRNSLVITSGEKREVLTNTREQDIINAIIKVTQEGKKTLYFTTGHGERRTNNSEPTGLQEAVNALKQETYVIKTINLAMEEKFPTDCDVLVIAGPKTDFFPQEIERIDDYIRGGGSVLFLFDAWRDNDNLVKYLEKKGVIVNNDLIIDPISKSLLGQYHWPMAASYGNHPVVRDFKIMSFFPLSRSLIIVEAPRSKFHWTPIAQTSQAAWGEVDKPEEGGQIKFNKDKDLSGPLTLAVAGSANYTPDEDKDEENKKEDKSEEEKNEIVARSVVFGDVEFVSNHFFRQQGNKNIFLNSVSWLAEQEDLISIRPKRTQFSPVLLGAADKRNIFLFTVLILPGVVFIAWMAMLFNKQ